MPITIGRMLFSLLPWMKAYQPIILKMMPLMIFSQLKPPPLLTGLEMP